MRRCGGLRGDQGNFKTKEQEKDWQRAEWVSHNDREFSIGGLRWSGLDGGSVLVRGFNSVQVAWGFEPGDCPRARLGGSVEEWPSSQSISLTAAGPIWALLF